MRAYSLDLRRHLVQAIQSGTNKVHAAAVFGVSVRTIDRYVKQLAETDTLAAKPIPGRPRQSLPEHHADLAAQLRAHADATLEQQCIMWADSHGIQVSPSTMSRTLARLGWTWKKRRWWPPNGTRTPGGSGGPTWRGRMPTSSSSSTKPVRTSP